MQPIELKLLLGQDVADKLKFAVMADYGAGKYSDLGEFAAMICAAIDSRANLLVIGVKEPEDQSYLNN